MATSPVFGWPLPDPSDLVRDLPTDFDAFSDAVEATLADVPLQVVTTRKTDTFTLSATLTLTAVTGLSVTLTPRATASRILVITTIPGYFSSGGSGGPNRAHFSILRDTTTNLSDPGSPGSRQAITGTFGFGSGDFVAHMALIDSPSTTSSTSYGVYASTAVATLNTIYVNRSATDTDSSAYWRGVATITAMELAS